MHKIAYVIIDETYTHVHCIANIDKKSAIYVNGIVFSIDLVYNNTNGINVQANFVFLLICGVIVMENASNMGNLFAILPDAYVLICEGKVSYMNPPAQKLFGREKMYMPDHAIIPQELLELQSDSFIASVTINDRVMTVSCSSNPPYKIYGFFSPNPQEDEAIVHTVSSAMRELTSGIKINTDLLNERSGIYQDPVLVKYSAVLNHYSARLKRLVNNYSLFSSLKQSRLKFNPSMVSLSEMCKELSEEISVLTLPKNVRISFSSEGETYASIDRELIFQMLTNFISNSLNHMPNGGQINLKVSSTKTKITFVVEDNGTGIPDEILASVFKGYLRSEFNDEHLDAGLGLSVADCIAKVHGGSLAIESKVNVGTRVVVQIPRVVDSCFMSPKAEYKVPMREAVMTDLSTWLTWEDYITV